MKKVTIFLGGTCADSTWREELIDKLDLERIEVFNPVVPNWTQECQEREIFHRENDEICLYVITPEGIGFYSFIEVVDDSNKRPDRTVLCVLSNVKGKTFEGHTGKCVHKTMELVARNGVIVFDNLDDLALYLNSLKKQKTLSKHI